MKKLALLILLLVGCVSLQAQTASKPASKKLTLTGKVVSSAGEPVIGATIMVEGSKPMIATAAGVDGSYSLTLPSGSVSLTVSSIGYNSRTVSVNNRTKLDITLETEDQQIDDVVVVGYQVQKKVTLTGSVSAISGKDIVKRDAPNLSSALQGLMPGVSVVQASGRPGADGGEITVRGIGSINSRTSPLVLIDGVEGDLNKVDMNSVESVSVLKDASAAIYGSRASNGVIIITTKKGSVDGTSRPSFNYNGNMTVSNVYQYMDVLSTEEFRQAFAEHANAPETFKLGNADVDWQKEIYRVALGTDHNLSMTGALKNMPYRVSVGYTNQNGTLKNNNYERINASVGLSPKFFDKHLSVDINVKGSIENNQPVSTGVIGSAISFDPTRPVYEDYEGNVGLGYYTWMNGGKPITLAAANPVADLELADKLEKTKRSIGNIALDYKVHGLEDLRFNLNMGYDIQKNDNRENVPDLAPSMYTGNQNDGTGKRYKYHQTKRNTLLDFYANYDKELKDHHINVMGGYGWQRFWYKNNSVTTDTEGKELATPQHAEAELYLLSFYGRVNYSWKQRYMLTATLRADASSRFSPDNRWGYFPSVAAAWRVNEEAFLSNFKALSDLKLRLSYGQTGQQSIGSYYQHLPTYTASYDESRYYFGDQWYTTYRPNGYDANIKWETTETYNIGIDYGFLNNRISGTIDYYWRTTKDLLNKIFVPAGSNFTNMIETNIGNMKSKGLEIGINVIPVKNKDWEWTVSGNFTWNTSEITKLNTIDREDNYVKTGNAGGTGKYLQVHMVGETPNTFYLLQQAYDDNGKPLDGKYIAKDGSVTSSEEDANKYVTGKSSKAPYYCGLSTRLTYKNWDLGINGHGSFGAYVYNYVKASDSLDGLYGGTGVSSNILRSTLETGFTQDRIYTDYFLEKGDFFRIDNITLGHTFDKLWNEKTSLRLSFTVQNVCTLTGYSGLDPEIYSGIDKNIYQRPRMFMLGVNLNF